MRSISAAFVLALAAGAMVVEDSFDTDAARRRSARRFLLFSPGFGLALWLGYLPWLPVLREARVAPARRARGAADAVPRRPNSGFPHLRARRRLSARQDRRALRARRGRRNDRGGVAAARAIPDRVERRRTRRNRDSRPLHPHYDFARRFVPAGPALVAVARPGARRAACPARDELAGAALLAAMLVLDGRGVRVYFREGRADWRTLADELRRHAAPSERVFTENQYSQLAVAFYLVGPNWLYDVESASHGLTGYPEPRGGDRAPHLVVETRRSRVAGPRRSAAARRPAPVGAAVPRSELPEGRRRRPAPPRPRASRRLARTNIRRSWTVSSRTRSTI